MCDLLFDVTADAVGMIVPGGSIAVKLVKAVVDRGEVMDSDTVAQAIGLPPEHIHITERPTLKHQSNRLYNVRAGEHHLILKEYLKPDEWDDAPRREFGALQLLAPLDIAPRPVFCEPAAPPRGSLVA